MRVYRAWICSGKICAGDCMQVIDLAARELDEFA